MRDGDGKGERIDGLTEEEELEAEKEVEWNIVGFGLSEEEEGC